MNFYQHHRVRGAIEALEAPGAKTEAAEEAKEALEVAKPKSKGKTKPKAAFLKQSSTALRSAQDRIETPLEGKPLNKSGHRRLVVNRARTILGRKVNLHSPKKGDRTDELETAVGDALEKVHLEANFLPAGFLREGAERVRGVCRIPFRTPEGGFVGSGFLVAPGVILTNNHVLVCRVSMSLCLYSGRGKR